MQTIVLKLVQDMIALTKRVLALEEPSTIPTSIKLRGDDGNVYTITIQNKKLTVS